MLNAGRFYEAGLRPDDLILDINGVSCKNVEQAVAAVNAEQRRRGKLSVRVLRHTEKAGAVRGDFHEFELPRKKPIEGKKTVPAATVPGPIARTVASNEHMADPGVWLEC